MQSQGCHAGEGGFAVAEWLAMTMRRPAFVNIKEVHWASGALRDK